ncbi:Putative oxidoreductase [Cronobacter universalis NCTC 9529]|nr:Putative oxidoreductase [Cronobacter universalis NCTC 9529]
MHYQPQRDLLQNRIILVTGASDGIGREAALTYARYGAHVLLLGRSEEKLRGVAREIEQEGLARAHWFTLDYATATPEACQRLAEAIGEQVPRLDGVLHNAGVLGDIVPMDQQNPAVWSEVMQVNVNVHLLFNAGAVAVAAEIRGRLAGVHHLKRRSSGPG